MASLLNGAGAGGVSKFGSYPPKFICFIAVFKSPCWVFRPKSMLYLHFNAHVFCDKEILGDI